MHAARPPGRHGAARLARQAAGRAGDPLFITRRGTPMTRNAVHARITRYQKAAAGTCPSLTSKNLTPHMLRHSAAMTLLTPAWTSPSSPCGSATFLEWQNCRGLLREARPERGRCHTLWILCAT